MDTYDIDSFIRKLVHRGGLKNVFFANATQGKLPAHASVNASPRLLISLSGRASYSIGGENGIQIVYLRARDSLFIPGGGWVKTEPRSQYRSLGLVFNPEYHRHYLTRGTRVSGEWTMQILTAEEYGKPRDPVSRHCLSLLSETSRSSSASLRYLSAANLLLSECVGLPLRNERTGTGIAWQRWQMARHFIEENLQEPLQRKDIAAYMQLHPNHISRLFKTYTGSSLNHFIRQARLDRAELLLANPKLNISEVAHLCGFTSSNYFIRLYRKRHGHPPGTNRPIESGSTIPKGY